MANAFEEYLKGSSTTDAQTPEILTEDVLSQTPMETPTITRNVNAFEAYLQGNQVPSSDIVPQQTVEEQPAVEPTVTQGYSEKDLTSDKHYGKIYNYMEQRFGVDEFRNYSKEDVVNKFLNNMRGFSGGNSVRAVQEISFLNDLKDNEEKLATVGEAYSVFEGMSSVFSSDTSYGEKAGAVGDYLRSTVLDPINLVGFGIGKLFTSGGTKVASKVAQEMAMAAFMRQTRKGATKEVATKVAERTWSSAFNTISKQNAAALAARKQAVENLPPGIITKLATTQAAKEVGTVAAIETAINIGTAYAYEGGLVRTGVQDEISSLNVGLAALGGLVMGGIQAGSVVSRGSKEFLGTESLSIPSRDVVQPTLNISTLSQSLPAIPYTSSLKTKASKAMELQDLDTEFFITMLLGNSEKGIKGLTEIMLDQGFSYVKRTPEDKISNYIADVIRKADPQDAKKFIKDFTDATGIKMVELTDKVTGKTKKQKISLEDFANIFAKKISQQGQMLNAVSQTARKLGVKDGTEVTIQQFTEAMLSSGIKGAKPGRVERVFDAVSTGTKETQNRLIRLLVTAPSTSYLNLVGWSAATTLNSATDMAVASLHFGNAGIQKIFGRGANASEQLRMANSLWRANKQRLRNLADPNMTRDAYLSLAQKDPQAMRMLTQIMSGGIDASKTLKSMGFDPNKTVIGTGADKTIDLLQKINFVTAQDTLTKSQEFVYQMDKNLRLAFNKSWSEFYTDPSAAATMNTKAYQESLSKAVYETQKATFSMSYKETSDVAAIIEEARNIPGIGLLVPFGKFFNNTVALAADGSGLTAAAKLVGLSKSQRSQKDLTIRAAIGLSAVYSFAETEVLNRDKGLAWDEKINETTGQVVSQKYDFPYSHWKAVGRWASYLMDGQEMPKEEMTDMLSVVGIGQLTRQLNNLSDGLGEAFITAATGDGPAKDRAMDIFTKSLGSIGSQAFSGATRSLDPLNQVVGLSRGSEYISVNRNDGSRILNDSMRYMDQIIAVVSGKDIAQEKFRGATGTVPMDAGKHLGDREIKVTSTSKILNMVGKPAYLADLKSKDPNADNRYNKLFHDMIENMSSDLLRLKVFREGDEDNRVGRLAIRQKLVKDIFKEAKEQTLNFMESGIENIGDVQLKRLIDIGSKYKWADIDRAMSKLSDMPTEFKDLSYQQLDLLEGYLDYEKTILDRLSPY
jgi:hypothetical protein